MPIMVKTEEACVKVVTDALVVAGYVPETNVFVRTGVDNEDLNAPAVICHAVEATEDFPYSGIYRVTANVAVKEMAADVNANDIGVLPDTVFHAFLVDNIEQLLGDGVFNYFVYQLRIDSTGNNTSGDAWEQTYRFEIVCALKP